MAEEQGERLFEVAMKKIWMLVLAMAFGRLALADAVTLTDGSVLKGKVTEQADGGVVVATAAGDIRVPKEKIASVTSENLPRQTTYGSALDERRARYGNDDGIPHEKQVLSSQLLFTLGEMLYSGDALNTGGGTFSTSDFNGMNVGFILVDSWHDNVGVEIWGGWSPASKQVKQAGAPDYSNVSVQRLDLGFSPRLQVLVPLGEQDFFITPHVGLGPVISFLSLDSRLVDPSGNVTHPLQGSAYGLGGAFHAGVDLQMAHATLSLKLRYLLSFAPGGVLTTSNIAAIEPMMGFGWAF
jgi:hypothetical protein